ncbi:hypothetical protein QNI16_25835 [Cytophagaceae bacterium YF14B1]|uniref:Uncharacterized protein n=1 Tax=Xanthocytophaga flava TaxID=3048013 RepID=A0AAE3QV35_9BACT|nr:hypothetical protein [Xanthocytophaga flavus]MDJ1483943.1 hypothetical protein [Xanthocytophaga flavus]
MDVQFKLYNTIGQPTWKIEQYQQTVKSQYKQPLNEIQELLYEQGETNTQINISIEIDIKNERVFPPVITIGDGTEEQTMKYQNLKKKIVRLLPE